MIPLIRPLSAFALAVACVVASSCGRTPESRAGSVLDASLSLRVLDSLETGVHPLLADPVGLYVDQGGRYVAVDRSDKMLKVYDASGRYLFAAGRPGAGPGEFGALWGGGALADSMFGYDFAKMAVSVFSPTGEYVRSFSARAGGGVPAAVQPVDDSLFLVVGFPLDGWKGELLTIIRRDGSVRSRFFDRREYFSPENPPLLEHTFVVADAHDGIVVAGIRGGDSLWVFDYDGRPLAAGPILVDGDTRLNTYRSLIAENRGKIRRPDQSWVIDNHDALISLVVADSGNAVVQVMKTTLGERPWVDLTEGGRFLVAGIDRDAGAVRTGGEMRLEQGLLGRDRKGHPLTFRYLDDKSEVVEVSQLTLQPGGAP